MQIEICLEHSQVMPRNLQHGWQRAYWIWDSNLGFDANSLEAPRHKFQDCREAGLLNSILYRFDCRSLDINKTSVLNKCWRPVRCYLLAEGCQQAAILVPQWPLSCG